MSISTCKLSEKLPPMQSTGEAQTWLPFQKLTEGGFNRTFEIIMNDGFEIIARIPYAIAFPRRLSVASEVATMRLAGVYGVPVSKILDYSITTDNPVGAEYILMEKASGEELGDRWFSLPDHERARLVAQMTKFESTLFFIPLPASGSVFYQKDLEPSTPSVPVTALGSSEVFCVGPSVEQRWWHERRDQLPIHRGPFLTAEEFLRAGAQKEISWLSSYGEPRFPALEHREFTNYQKSSHLEHLENLQKYLKITPYLIPSSPQHLYLLKPTLRHPDINPRNIFVDKDLKISSLIDWQHSSAVPLFLQADVPDCFANFGDEESLRLRRPKLPDDLDTLSEFEREEAIDKFRRQHLHFYYFAGSKKFNKPHYDALLLPSTPLKQRLCFNASAPWRGNNIPLKARLIEATRRWPVLPVESFEDRSRDCPLGFTDEEAKACLSILAEQDAVDENIEEIRGRMGIGSDGWVPVEDYENAVLQNQAMKDEGLAGQSEEEKRITLQHWPFDDHDEDC